jgi:hypothetical protein
LRESARKSISRDLYLDTDRATRELAQFSHDGPLWFWYAYRPQKDQHYSSIASTYIWATRLIGRNLPDLTDVRFDVPKRGVYLALMESDDAVLQQAITALEAHGISLDPVTRIMSTVGENRYTICLERVTRADLPPKVNTATPSAEGLIPDTEVLDYDLPDLIKHFGHSIYGKPSSGPESYPPGIYRITDPRDHFGIKFLPVKDFGSMSAVEITIVDQKLGKQYGAVNMILQDQDFQTLYWSGTLPDGTARTLVGIPPGARSIRIVFLANDDSYIRFPQHVRIRGLKSR